MSGRINLKHPLAKHYVASQKVILELTKSPLATNPANTTIQSAQTMPNQYEITDYGHLTTGRHFPTTEVHHPTIKNVHPSLPNPNYSHQHTQPTTTTESKTRTSTKFAKNSYPNILDHDVTKIFHNR